MNTSIMNATAAMTMAEATEKVGFITKAKSFVKEHKTHFIIGGTAVISTVSGILVDKAFDKAKDCGLKDKLKSKKKKGVTEEDYKKELDAEIEAANTAAEKTGEEPVKDVCKKECDQQHSA